MPYQKNIIFAPLRFIRYVRDIGCKLALESGDIQHRPYIIEMVFSAFPFRIRIRMVHIQVVLQKRGNSYRSSGSASFHPSDRNHCRCPFRSLSLLPARLLPDKLAGFHRNIHALERWTCQPWRYYRPYLRDVVVCEEVWSQA